MELPRDRFRVGLVLGRVLGRAACSPPTPFEHPQGDTATALADTAAVPDDDDGDGFFDGEDCDDANPAAHPGAPEICDGVDDDCDGEVDEDVAWQRAWFTDADGDGWGDRATAVVACAGGTGTVDVAGDCDDADPSVHAFAAETCDGRDEDCDGEADEDAVDAVRVYDDADGDGWGEAETGRLACGVASGAALSGGDCDESDPSVNPGVPEICDDGVDDDCDGHAEACDPFGRHAATENRATLHADDARELWDGALGGLGDMDGDGLGDLFVGAPGVPPRVPGVVYVLAGPVSGDVQLAASTARFADGDLAVGASVAAAGDVDGDGFDDLLVGVPDHAEDVGPEGAAFLLRGPLAGSLAPADASATLVGEGALDEAGRDVAGLGDATGDGVPDLAVGAFGADRIYLVQGPVTGTYDLATSAGVVEGAPGDGVGEAVDRIGDLDGDGLDDLVACACRVGWGSLGFFLAPVAGTVRFDAADLRVVGSRDEPLPSSWSALGDLDGDGLDDVILGDATDATAGSGAGSASVWGGSATGVLQSTPRATLLGELPDDGAGSSVAGAGDVDGDGLPDLLVGALTAARDGMAQAGGAWVVLGPVSGTSSLSDADGIITGTERDDQAGVVSGAGDLDADGFDDFLIGTVSVSPSPGEVYLFPGGPR